MASVGFASNGIQMKRTDTFFKKQDNQTIWTCNGNLELKIVELEMDCIASENMRGIEFAW